MTHLELSNPDCYSNKIKLGNRGAQALSDYLKSPTCLISILELSGAHLTNEGFRYVVDGVVQCKSLISLNLSNNALGTF